MVRRGNTIPAVGSIPALPLTRTETISELNGFAGVAGSEGRTARSGEQRV